MSESLFKRSESWRSLVQAYQVCTQKYSNLMSQFELTPSQLDVLIQIEALSESARPKAIAEGLLVTKGNITSVTKRLIERQLIEQHSNLQDKRSSVFKLTEQGEVLLQQAKKAARSFIEAQLSPFSDEEVHLVGDLMQKMRSHLESEQFDRAISVLQTNRLLQESAQ